MTVPIDGIRAFHNAFSKDMKAIDAGAYSAARGEAGLDLVLKRYTFFNEVLVWHANGEEEFVFTTLEPVAPLVAEAYQRDHRGLDTLFTLLDRTVKASDVLQITRATSAFDFFLNFHLTKEMAHLYRIFEERVPMPDQWAVVGKLSQKIPSARFPEVINWLFPLIGIEDRENVVRIFRQLMPAPAFAGTTQLIRAAVGDGWTELTRRIPELS